jgi:hypothetical protein
MEGAVGTETGEPTGPEARHERAGRRKGGGTVISPLELPDVQQRKLAAVMNAACRVFPRRYRADGCIAAARVLVDVLDRLHVHCRPLAVVVDVFNPAMVARAAAEGGRLPADTEEYHRWISDCGAWWLTLGGGGEPAGAGEVAGARWRSGLGIRVDRLDASAGQPTSEGYLTGPGGDPGVPRVPGRFGEPGREDGRLGAALCRPAGR